MFLRIVCLKLLLCSALLSEVCEFKRALIFEVTFVFFFLDLFGVEDEI